ncbi:MAG: acetoin utilization deacetylase AcuC-like enzyme [Candidatus Endobugula sp.]|jgi:acetoin utilization deacetylase AcuC-like enzyme
MTIPVVSHPAYSFSFPGNHRFPMEKFSLLTQYLQESGISSQKNHYRPGNSKPALLKQAHCPNYIERFINNTLAKNELRRMGLPWSKGLVRRTLISPNGTFLAAQLALKHGIACHLAGGTHHAHFDFASGFCIFNDLAITAKALLAQKKVAKLLIFDCDVHQGDGTASILGDDDRAYTCSIHCEKNFPAKKALSNYDVGLPPKTQDDDYLLCVSDTLEKLIRQEQPELIIYDAGVDVYTGDPLGLLDISLEGIRQREKLVLTLCKKHDIPVVTVIGGGYDDDRYALAQRHAMVVEEAFNLFEN